MNLQVTSSDELLEAVFSDDPAPDFAQSGLIAKGSSKLTS
jgi:hypothetical protein